MNGGMDYALELPPQILSQKEVFNVTFRTGTSLITTKQIFQ